MELRTKVGVAVVVVGLVALVARPTTTPQVAGDRETVRPRPSKTEGVTTPEAASAPRVVEPVVAPTRPVQIERDARGRPTRFAAGELVEGVRRDAAGRLVEAFAGPEALRFTHGDDGHVQWSTLAPA